jgi:hypothetical protein
MKIQYSYPVRPGRKVEKYISAPAERSNEVALDIFKSLLNIPGLNFKYEGILQNS